MEVADVAVAVAVVEAVVEAEAKAGAEADAMPRRLRTRRPQRLLFSSGSERHAEAPPHVVLALADDRG